MTPEISNKFKSPNFDNRRKNLKIKYIILHYTETNNLMDAKNILCDLNSEVSCHYLINCNGKVYELVNVQNRAWHAGDSSWKNDSNLNHSSIGIEIVNKGEREKDKFKKKQIVSLINLILMLKKKFKICTENILGHSDIAPLRKIDPGIFFPWDKLSEQSIGLPTNKYFRRKEILARSLNNVEVKRFLKNLKNIGYNHIQIENKYNKKNSIVIQSFHRHFLPCLLSKKPNEVSLLTSIEILNFKKNN